MRVMLLLNCLKGGGAESAARRLHDVFPRVGVTSSLVAIRNQHIEAEPDSEIFTLGKQPGRGPRDVLPSVIRLRRLVAGWEPDLIHAHCELPELMLLSLDRRNALLSTEHSRRPWSSHRPIGYLVRRLLAARGCQYSVPQPDMSIRWLQRCQPLVVPNPVEAPTSIWHRTTRSNIIELVHVGRLVESKGVLDLLEVVERLAPRISITLIGDGPARPYLEARIKESSLPVRLLGFLSDPWSQAMKADIFISASRSESDGLSAVEAITRAIPVLLRSIPGHRTLPVNSASFFSSTFNLVSVLEDILRGVIGLSDLQIDDVRRRELIRERLPATVATQWRSIYEDVARRNWS
jgi:glycosyltransferase involved in cell wall biosynthesis